MRELQTLRAEPRAKVGGGSAYRIRCQGFIPAIVYGGKTGPQPVQVEEKSFLKLHSSGTLLSTLFMLEVGGKKTRVIPRSVQLDPITDRPIHVDFLRLEEGARIALRIPVHFNGHEESPGLKQGGVLNVVRHEVELYCPVENIPSYIEGDLSGLEIGDTLHISAFPLPEGVVPVIQNRDFTVATVAAPTTYVEEVSEVAEGEEVPVEGVPVEGEEGEAAAAGEGAPDKGKAAEKK